MDAEIAQKNGPKSPTFDSEKIRSKVLKSPPRVFGGAKKPRRSRLPPPHSPCALHGYKAFMIYDRVVCVWVCVCVAFFNRLSLRFKKKDDELYA